MALLRCDFFSQALEVGTSLTVLLPEPTAGIGLAPASDAAGGDVPLLYLAWLPRLGPERLRT